jgi:hypothetical protein
VDTGRLVAIHVEEVGDKVMRIMIIVDNEDLVLLTHPTS